MIGINPQWKHKSARVKGAWGLLEAVQAAAQPKAREVRANQPQPGSALLAGGGKSCRRKEEEAKRRGKKKKETLQRALGKHLLCRRGCSYLGATALCGDQSTKGVLEHSVTEGPRQTSDDTKTQGHSTATAACPGSFQWDGQKINEDEGSWMRRGSWEIVYLVCYNTLEVIYVD